MEDVTGKLETTKPELTGETLQNYFAPKYNPEDYKMLCVKKLDPNAKLPKQDKIGDAGYDLYALNDSVVPSLFKRMWRFVYSRIVGEPQDNDSEWLATKIPTGIAMEIPYGCVGLISDRSGMGSKLLKVFGGVIDSTYRGDVTVCLGNFSFKDHHVKAGDRVAQIVITECKSYPVVDVGDSELSKTVREDRGFGSSGS